MVCALVATCNQHALLSTAFCVPRLVCAPPCVCTALCVHRRSYYAYGSLRSTRGPAPAPPLNNKTPALLHTAFCVHRLVCAPPCVCTAGPTMHTARCARRGG